MTSAPVVAVVFFVALAGCLASTPAEAPGQVLLCDAPCEFIISDAPTRAFEPIAARHPTNPDTAVVVSTTFRDDANFGYPSSFNVHLSDSRGEDWTTYDLQSALPPHDPVATYTILADPMLTWFDDGTLLLFGMGGTGFSPRDGPVPGLAFTSFDIWMLTSTDAGATWGPAQVIAEGQGFQSQISAGRYHDQPFVARGAGTSAVLAWVQQMTEPDGTEASAIVVARTNDAGATWSEPSIVDEGPTLHNARAVLLGDRIVVAYRDVAEGYGPAPLHLRTSADGKHWSDTALVAQAASRPMMASNSTTMWLVYGNEEQGLVLRESVDAGQSWTSTTLADLDPYWDPLVMVSGAADRPVVAWYEGGDGERRCMVWDGVAQQISTTTIGPMTPTGVLGWNSLGDYMGLDVRPDGGIAAWITGEGSSQDVAGAWIN